MRAQSVSLFHELCIVNCFINLYTGISSSHYLSMVHSFETNCSITGICSSNLNFSRDITCFVHYSTSFPHLDNYRILQVTANINKQYQLTNHSYSSERYYFQARLKANALLEVISEGSFGLGIVIYYN